MHDALVLLYHAARILCALVGYSFLARTVYRHFGYKHSRWYEFMSTVYFNLKPFYLVALTIATAWEIHGVTMRPIDYIIPALSYWFGFMIHNDEDDDERWKRRREKLAAKVEAVGGKLVVVPVGSNA